MTVVAPFETFREHGEREMSDEPHNEAFIRQCRDKALEYDGMEPILRKPLLQDLERCIPFHFRKEVFHGIQL